MGCMALPSGIDPGDLLNGVGDGFDENDIQNLQNKARQIWLIVVLTLPIICFALVTLLIGWLTDFILRRRGRDQAAHNRRF